MIDAEVAERGAEEDRRQFALQERVLLKLVRSAFHQLQLVAQLRRQILADRLIQLRVIQPFNDAYFLNGVAFA